MKGLKLKWPGTGRLRRTVLTLAAVGATAGGLLLVAAPAQALVGTDPTPGTVAISPATGPTTTQATWGTTDGCPTGFQTSAGLYEVTGASTTQEVSGTVNLSGGAAIAAGQAMGDTMGNLLSLASVPAGGSVEWVVKCSSVGGSLGVIGSTGVYYQDIIISLNAAGTTYTASAPAAAVNTTTTGSASPNPANSGQSVTLTATVVAANNTAVTGSVTFMNGSTVVNSTAAPVTCTTATPPVCTATYTITGGLTATTSFTAVFTPGSGFNGSTSPAFTENINASGTTTAGTIGVSVTIAATGSLTVTIPTTTAVLTPNTGETSATGNLGTITVADTYNTYPGFAVYGQEVANFTGSGLPTGVTSASIPNTDLGWQPVGTLAGGAALGPSSSNIGAAPAVLVFAHAGTGFGTDTVNPALTLTLPAGTPIGTYTGGVVITYVSAFA